VFFLTAEDDRWGAGRTSTDNRSPGDAPAAPGPRPARRPARGNVGGAVDEEGM